jgi:hypothetical protein
MSHYPETRAASGHAWRRLRKHTDSRERKDIAYDIAQILRADVSALADVDKANLIGTVEFALSAFNWADKDQA